MTYRLVDHTGDTAVELSAPTAGELVREAARGFCSIVVDTTAAAPRPVEGVDLELEAEDGESLLVDFLNELIFLFDSRRLLPWDVEISEVSLDRPARLRATVRGETFDASRHVFQTEVKAATFHDVHLERTAAGLRTVVVFDL